MKPVPPGYAQALPRDCLRDILNRASKRLDSRLEAELLITLGLNRTRAWLLAHAEYRPTELERERIDWLLARRADGTPIAYLHGKREFYGREFCVDPAVLIPRPETEYLIEWALTLELPDRARVADIGTGSGCIALTLAAERPRWHCVATDISAEALAVAAENHTRLGLDGVELLQGNLLSPLAGRKLDLILSNPPYVTASDPHLQQGDVRFEPDIALSAGADGLILIRALVEDSRRFLAPGGWLLLEHGYDQAAAVRELFHRNGYENIESRHDLAGIERVTGGRTRC